MAGSDLLALSGQTACFSSAGLTVGGTGATIKIAAPNGAGIDYAIDGLAYHKADTDNIDVTAHAVQAALTSCLYLVQITSGGTVSTKKGNEELTADLGVTASLQWPYPDDDNCPIGGYKIEVATGYTYTNGTTENDATGITDTYYNFAGGMPLAPITA